MCVCKLLRLALTGVSDQAAETGGRAAGADLACSFIRRLCQVASRTQNKLKHKYVFVLLSEQGKMIQS